MNQPTVDIFLPDLRGGGAERVCLNLANEFAGRGIQVRMVLMQAEGEFLALLDRRVEVVTLGALRVRNVLWPLMCHLRRKPPTAMLANMWPLTFLAVLACKLARVDCRVVAVEHVAWSAGLLIRKRSVALGFKASMKWLQPRSGSLLAVSRGAAEDLIVYAGLPSGSVSVQYNPIVQVTHDEMPSSFPILDLAWLHGNSQRIIAVGAHKQQKDFPALLIAFAELRKWIDARLLILGEGDERPKLEAIVRDLGLENAVELPGFVVDTAPYYASADLFVLSSDHEGFGNVIVEALSYGVPVVSTDCPSGPREILEDGKYGRLVPLGDTMALAQAMLESLQTPHDHAALKARARDFAVDTIADQYLHHLLPGWHDEVAKEDVGAYP